MTNEEIIIGALKRIEEKLDLQNGRIRKLENWRSFIVGGMALIAFLMIVLMPTVVGQWLGS